MPTLKEMEAIARRRRIKYGYQTRAGKKRAGVETVEEFLARGGEIQHIPPGVSGDPYNITLGALRQERETSRAQD